MKTNEDLQAEAKRIADHDAKFGEGSWEEIQRQFVEAMQYRADHPEHPQAEAARAALSEDRNLQAEADYRATLDEFWNAIYEEGEEQGDRDAANGRADNYALALEAIKFHPQFPYWQGYVKGYEDSVGEPCSYHGL